MNKTKMQQWNKTYSDVHIIVAERYERRELWLEQGQLRRKLRPGRCQRQGGGRRSYKVCKFI